MRSASEPARLVVRSDGAALRRRFVITMLGEGVLVLVLVVLVGVTASSASGLGVVGWVLPVLLVGLTALIAVECYQVGGRLAVSHPLTLDAWGVTAQTRHGSVRVPWQAVTQVGRSGHGRSARLTFSVHPQAVVGQRGVEADPHLWQRCRDKGISIGTAGIAPDVDAVVAAVRQFTQGRVPLV